MSLNDLLFGSVTSNAERELANYNPRTETREKELGDRLGDFFTGRGGAIDQEVKDLYISNLTNKFGTKISRLKSDLATELTPEQLQNLNINARTNKARLESTIADLELLSGKRDRLIEAADELGYGKEARALKTGAITDMLRTKRDKKVKEAEEKALTETQRLEGVVDRRNSEARQEAARIRADAQLKADKIRSADLQMSLMQMENKRLDSQDQFRLGQMDRDIANRRLDMEQANINQKNQMAAIATLMQGLQGINQSVKPPRSYFNL